jgi:hypothetical protein
MSARASEQLGESAELVGKGGSDIGGIDIR